MKKIFYSWRQLQSDCRKIARVYQDQNIRNIYGIPRGGLPIAVAISHQLGKPLIIDKKEITSQTLVVDDISDSGTTLTELFENVGLQNIPTACPWIMDETMFMPRIFIRKKKKDEWVVFPWERYDELIV